MKSLLSFLAGLAVIFVSGCTDEHLVSNKEYLAIIEKSFCERKQLAHNREAELFSVFSQNLSTSQTEALKFLFAYMPLNDLADYNGEFFLANADISLQARKETPWGKNIPEDIFLHYVLPYRVNNENLDSFRIIYYNEIHDRIRGMDISDAALEINHWCHEKVSYQPADIRTSAPLSTILSARGRCGEESTFTTAALRTAGIPARQVYTPRWAHSDDNHAWVEIWIDGEWYYMGACEPEPFLDMGWFTEPAGRAMLVHTKSFGAPLGNENSMLYHRNYTEVNNLSKYAPTKTIFIKVLNNEGTPLNNVNVEYQLYNYAEFYPIAKIPTDENGISNFETGFGDLLIWASEKDYFNFAKISVSETDTLKLTLNRKAEGEYGFDLDLNVPVAPSPKPAPSTESVKKNKQRINEENTIRQKYIDSWMQPSEAMDLALKLNIDTGKTRQIFARSNGNYKEIRSFLSNTTDSMRNLAVTMLEILADKDLRDMKEYTLSDHLKFICKPPSVNDEKGYDMFINYLLNPRIANEIIAPWRGYFMEKLEPEFRGKAVNDPSLVIKYIKENITINNNENYYGTPLTPIGVNELKVSDKDSRSIFFIAICRSIGIPSRLEPGTNVPQYYFRDTWVNVCFDDQKQSLPENGYLKLVSDDFNPVPEYYIHFTIAKFENGHYNTLEYDYYKKITDFNEELALPPGHYMIVTGKRQSDSKILSGISFFDLSGNEHKTIEIKLRNDASEIREYGKIDLHDIISLLNDTDIAPEKIISEGTVILWIDRDTEPTKHILNELLLLKEELDSWGGYFLFLSDSSKNGRDFNYEVFKELPGNSLTGIDSQMRKLKSISNSLNMHEVSLPCVIMTDKNGNILFKSTGYMIGTGKQILKHINY